jgi:hypothetical protein
LVAALRRGASFRQAARRFQVSVKSELDVQSHELKFLALHSRQPDWQPQLAKAKFEAQITHCQLNE